MNEQWEIMIPSLLILILNIEPERESMKYLYLFIMSIGLIPQHLAAAEINIESILCEYERSLSNCSVWAIKAETITKVSGTRSNLPPDQITKSEFYCDHDRWDIKTWYDQYNKKGIKTLSSNMFRMISDDYILNTQYSKLDDGTIIPQSVYTKTGVKIKDKRTIKTEALTSLWGGDTLIGYFAGDGIRLVELLKMDKHLVLRNSMDKVDGVECYVIEARPPNHGHYTVWFDPNHGFYPVKLIAEKSGKDLYNGESLSTPNVLPPGAKAGYIPPMIISCTYIYDAVKINQFQSNYLPTSCHIKETRNFSDGTNVVFDSIHSRTEIEVTPDFKALDAFISDLPDGARVYYDDFPGILYEWRNGKPTPKIDINIVDSIQQNAKGYAGETKTVSKNETITKADQRSETVTIKPSSSGNDKSDNEQRQFSAISKISIAILLSAVMIALFILMKRKGFRYDN